MANRYYLPEEISQKELNKRRQHLVCAECGEWVNFWLEKAGGPTYLACHRHNMNGHEGVAREFSPPSEQFNLARREAMSEENIRQDRELAKGVPLSGLITREQATTILTTVWPGAPKMEVFKAAILCRDYGLHPLMKHIFLIKYDRYAKQIDGSRKKVGEDWTTVLGIGATRLMMSRQGTFSYIDDTPRIMSDKEQKRIFGKVDPANIVAITKLRTKSGLEAMGYGKYPRDGKPMGTDKGNSVENMAFIRSERSAFGRLFPDARLPRDVDVVDEQYMETPSGRVNTETGEIVAEADAVIDGEVITSPDEDVDKTEQEENPESKAPPELKRDPETIKTTAELQKALFQDFHIQPKAQMAELNLRSWSELAITPSEAYIQIAAIRR